MKFQVKDILKITEGKLLGDSEKKFFISTDTRTISPDEIFLPLVGANFNGHDFIETALNKGCFGYFTDKNHKDKANFHPDRAKFVIEVENTLEAYLKLANFKRNKINPIVIAVTGSSGKTTTKEMIFSVLSQQYKTHKSNLNHNNEVGLCQTLLGMPDDTEFLVVEMGMRALGEIEILSKYAEPDIAVITNIGPAHIGKLGSIENIARAKCEISKYLNKNGVIIAYNDPLIKKYLDWNRKIIYYSLNNSKDSEFIYKNNSYKLSVSGEYNITNSLAAIEIGLLYNISPETINKGLIQYRPIDNRWQIIELFNNIKLINDSYNANPDSVKASVNAMISSYPESKIILVLGDMAELGEYTDFYHREIGKFLNDKPIFELITVGEKAKLITETIKNNKIKIKSFTQNNEVVEYFINNFNKQANSAVLLKASRCMRFENIVEQLQRNKPC
ncbi:MAG: UDP-N-acetylmuramoyl-tripeptide--D-alanyl-D-alanine ligase [bacterium]